MPTLSEIKITVSMYFWSTTVCILVLHVFYIVFLYCFILSKWLLFGLFSAWAVTSLQFFHKCSSIKYQITQQGVISMTFISNTKRQEVPRLSEQQHIMQWLTSRGKTPWIWVKAAESPAFSEQTVIRHTRVLWWFIPEASFNSSGVLHRLNVMFVVI